MKCARFYCDSIRGGSVELAGAEAHHLADVLRLRAGDRAELFDGAGTLAEAVVRKIQKGEVLLQVEAIEQTRPRQSGRIIIATSVAKGERFDWLIGKCTELGIDRICPVLFERTVKLAKASAVDKRYGRIALAAAKQCGRLFLPVIDKPVAFERSLETLKKDYPQAKLLAGSFQYESQPLVRLTYTGDDTVVFIGPEGGMTEKEENLLRQHAVLSVRLTETVLRIETAAVAFAAILAAQRDAAGQPGNR